MMNPLSSFWPSREVGVFEDWNHLIKDLIDHQGLRLFRSGPGHQETVHRQLHLRKKKRLKSMCRSPISRLSKPLNLYSLSFR